MADKGNGKLTNEPRIQPLEIDCSKEKPHRIRRSCTDTPCLILFMCFLGGWVYVAYFAISHGELDRILVPRDSYNQVCGTSLGVKKKQYLLSRFNIEECNDLPNCVKTLQICVESCPQNNFKWGNMELSIDDLKERLICLPVKKTTFESYDNMELAISENRCLDFYTKSTPILNFCFYDSSAWKGDWPANLKLEELIPTQLSSADGVKDIQLLGLEIFQDLLSSWSIVVTALGATLLISLVFVTLMRWLAAPMLWITVIGTLIGLLFAIHYNIVLWTGEPTAVNHGLDQALKNYVLQCSATSIISMCLCFAVISASILVFRRHIPISIALTKTSSNVAFKSFSTMLFPIVSWLLFLSVSVYAATVCLYLFANKSVSFQMTRARTATGTLTNEDCECEGPAVNYTVGGDCSPQLFSDHCHIYGPNDQDPIECKMTQCSYSGVVYTPFVKWAIAYNVFGYFWVSSIVFSFSDMVLAATFSRWCLTLEKPDVTLCMLAHNIIKAIRYHLGTLAFGFLVLIPCRFLSSLLSFIGFILKRFDYMGAVSIRRHMSCCYLLMEEHLQSLNSNAYIMCAIHGSDLLTSVRLASYLIMRNSTQRLVRLDTMLTKFMFVLYKILLTACAGLATYYFLNCYPSIIPLHYKLVPAVLVAIGAYPVVSVSFDAYSIAAKTVALCLLEDCVLNDGSPEKPYTMPTQLRKFLCFKRWYYRPPIATGSRYRSMCNKTPSNL